MRCGLPCRSRAGVATSGAGLIDAQPNAAESIGLSLLLLLESHGHRTAQSARPPNSPSSSSLLMRRDAGQGSRLLASPTSQLISFIPTLPEPRDRHRPGAQLRDSARASHSCVSLGVLLLLLLLACGRSGKLERASGSRSPMLLGAASHFEARPAGGMDGQDGRARDERCLLEFWAGGQGQGGRAAPQAAAPHMVMLPPPPYMMSAYGPPPPQHQHMPGFVAPPPHPSLLGAAQPLPPSAHAGGGMLLHHHPPPHPHQHQAVAGPTHSDHGGGGLSPEDAALLAASRSMACMACRHSKVRCTKEQPSCKR